MFFGKRFSGYHSGRLSGLDILVLSMIKNNNGISGYELIQKVNKKFKDLWKASAGTIYPLLSRLAEKNLVEIEELMRHNRQIKSYNITDVGKKALKKVLENNLEPSINCLGDYIRTIIKASVPSEKFIDKVMHCFPFPEIPFDEQYNASDFSKENIERLKRIIWHLNHGKETLEEKLKGMNGKIEKYSKILEKIETERYKNAKPIEIVDNDEDFENF